MDDLEFWLKGSIPEIPILLQPVAHALLQVQKELKEVLEGKVKAQPFEDFLKELDEV